VRSIPSVGETQPAARTNAIKGDHGGVSRLTNALTSNDRASAESSRITVATRGSSRMSSKAPDARLRFVRNTRRGA